MPVRTCPGNTALYTPNEAALNVRRLPFHKWEVQKKFFGETRSTLENVNGTVNLLLTYLVPLSPSPSPLY